MAGLGAGPHTGFHVPSCRRDCPRAAAPDTLVSSDACMRIRALLTAGTRLVCAQTRTVIGLSRPRGHLPKLGGTPAGYALEQKLEWNCAWQMG